VDRKLFWRFKGLWQRAARIGDWKYLKTLDNTFLFNVVDDPLERANLKERRKDVYDRLVGECSSGHSGARWDGILNSDEVWRSGRDGKAPGITPGS
jgi:hypothetical protein